MASFKVAVETQTELAGDMKDLLGRIIAIKPLSRNTVDIKTKDYGMSPALRVQTVDIESSEDTGTRLLFWTSVQETVLASTKSADWAVGMLEQVPQKNDPSRSVYLFTAPEDLDYEEIGNVLDSIEAPF